MSKKARARAKARATEVTEFAAQVQADYASLDLDPKRTTAGLGYVVHERGEGEALRKGETVSVHYVGLLARTGEVFDESFSDGRPIKFRLGAGEVIGGWDIGVGLLHHGDRASLFIPAPLGYGADGTEGIPGGAELLFYVEVL